MVNDLRERGPSVRVTARSWSLTYKKPSSFSDVVVGVDWTDVSTSSARISLHDFAYY